MMTEAILISFIFFALIAGMLYYFYLKIAEKIRENSLRNSTYTLLEMEIWDDKKTIKDLQSKLKVAMDDSIRAHKERDELAKIIKNGN